MVEAVAKHLLWHGQLSREELEQLIHFQQPLLLAETGSWTGSLYKSMSTSTEA